MGSIQKPDLKLAKRVLPKPLLKSIEHIFLQGISGCALVGGTALSGFYAGHRKSDDIDIFTRDASSQRMGVLAAKSLSTMGVKISEESSSAQYYHAFCEFQGHRFTVDVVEDSNLFRVGKFITTDGGVTVADLETILRMKVATLVSRCSEKDLYDLKWLQSHFPEMAFKALIPLGQSIDKGVNSENILAVLSNNRLREEACSFSLDAKTSAKRIFQELKTFQQQLVKELLRELRNLPAEPLGALARKTKKVLK